MLLSGSSPPISSEEAAVAAHAVAEVVNIRVPLEALTDISMLGGCDIGFMVRV